MPTLNVSFDIDLEDDEVEAIADAIGCTEANLAGELPKYGQAALREYADMMIGTGPIITATDVKERRLLRMIEIALGGRIPDRDRVAKLFNITPTNALSLVRTVNAKHRRRLAAAVRAEVQDFLAACVQDPQTQDWKVTWLNPVLIEILNTRLESAALSKARIRRDADALGAYVVPNGSYTWIQANP